LDLILQKEGYLDARITASCSFQTLDHLPITPA
jgi:hypothetical protein